MIRRNARKLLIVPGAERLRLFQMGQSIRVVPGFKFAQPKKTPRRSGCRGQLRQLLEAGGGFGKMISVVLQRSEIPPALLPVRADL